jgi:hypothetical protein
MARRGSSRNGLATSRRHSAPAPVTRAWRDDPGPELRMVNAVAIQALRRVPRRRRRLAQRTRPLTASQAT